MFDLLKRFCRWVLREEIEAIRQEYYSLGAWKYLPWLRAEHDITVPSDFKLTNWSIRQAHKDRKPLGRQIFQVYEEHDDSES